MTSVGGGIGGSPSFRTTPDPEPRAALSPSLIGVMSVFVNCAYKNVTIASVTTVTISVNEMCALAGSRRSMLKMFIAVFIWVPISVKM